MTRPPFTRLIDSLPAVIPFVGPETIERRQGRLFRARIGANESAFGVSPAARDAMTKAVDRTPWYCDPEGYELRSLLAKRNGVTLENVTLGAGIDDLLGVIVRVFMNPDDVVVASLGSYPTFAYHITGYGGRLKTVPYRNDRNDLLALTDYARNEKASILFLANPDNPTGSFYGTNAISDLMDRLPEGCLFILDEAYLDFVPPDAILPVDCDDPRIIRVRTFSKAHGMAGARIGYALAHRDIVDAFNKIRLHFGVNLIAQAGAMASLGDTEFIDGVIREVAKGRGEYERIATDAGVSTLASMTNFVAFDFGTAERANRVMNELIQRGVFVRKPVAPVLDRLIRITVGDAKDRAVFAEIFSDVMRAL